MDRRHLTVVRGGDATQARPASDSDPPDAVFDELLTVMAGDDDHDDAANSITAQQGGVPIAWSSKPDPAAPHV